MILIRSNEPVIAAKPVAQTIDIERIFGAVDLDATGGEALDRRLGDIDQFDMRKIVGLEVAGIDAEPLAAEHVVRAQQVGRRRILDDAADLGARKIGDGVVGGLLEQQVAERAEERQAAAFPGLLILLFAFLVGSLPARASC